MPLVGVSLFLFLFQVFGPSDYPDPSQPMYIPDGYPPSGTGNLAINKTVAASTTVDPSYPPSNAVDGNCQSQWSASGLSYQTPSW